jgi:hypothetical protein
MTSCLLEIDLCFSEEYQNLKMEAAGFFGTLKFYQTVRGHFLADSFHVNHPLEPWVSKVHDDDDDYSDNNNDNNDNVDDHDGCGIEEEVKIQGKRLLSASCNRTVYLVEGES